MTVDEAIAEVDRLRASNNRQVTRIILMRLQRDALLKELAKTFPLKAREFAAKFERESEMAMD